MGIDMIERLYIKNHLSFKEVELNLKKGLILFSGSSGAGKSVLMSAVLSLFGYEDVKASVIEATVPVKLSLESYGLEEDEPNVFRAVKTKSARYFLNNQTLSKKRMNLISKKFINYLSLRESNEFEDGSLLEVLDRVSQTEESLHVKELEEYGALFGEYTVLKDELEDLSSKEKKIEELKEFIKFEISRIDEVDPKVGEDEELLRIKRELSKKEKIEETLREASAIFDYESKVSEALKLIQKESSFFDETMNELRALFEMQSERLQDLEDIDIEEVLERLEKISSLKSRYGEIEDILEYKDRKTQELKRYENITFEKRELEKRYDSLKNRLNSVAESLSKRREKYLYILEDKINSYLQMLYMPKIRVSLKEVPIGVNGKDMVELSLKGIDVKKISSGEYNRLRLAFLAVRSEYFQQDGGVLILDEIDANLSGKESMSVAKVLEFLANRYQIFAISHQPQLTSRADLHFLVSKKSDESFVKLLNEKERVEELSRMISGENINSEAVEFAKSLLEGRGE